jgi:hypothetical protein
MQSKLFRASLAGPNDRSGVATRIIAKIFQVPISSPRHHDGSLEAARHTRSIPHAHHFRPLQILIQDRAGNRYP